MIHDQTTLEPSLEQSNADILVQSELQMKQLETIDGEFPRVPPKQSELEQKFQSKQYSSLDVYESRIAESLKLMDMQGKQLELLTERGQQLVIENKELRESRQKAFQFRAKSNNRYDENHGNNNKQKENKLLHDQCTLLSKELKIANGNIAKRDKSLAELSESASTASELIQSLEQKVNLLESEKQACEQHLIKVTSESSQNGAKRRELIHAYGNLQNQYREILEKYEEDQRIKKELESEATQLSKQVKILVNSEKVKREQSDMHETKLETLTIKLRDLETELTFAKQESKGLLDLNKSLQGRIKTLKNELATEKEKKDELCSHFEEVKTAESTLLSKNKILKQELDRILKERQEESSKIIQSTTESMKRVTDSYQNDLSEKFKHAEAMVSEVNKLKYLLQVKDSERQCHLNEVSNLEEVLSAKEDKLTKLIANLREVEIRKTENENLVLHMKNEVGSLKKQLGDSNKEISSIESKIEKERKLLETEKNLLLQEINELRHDKSSVITEVDDLKVNLNETIQRHKNEINKMKAETNTNLTASRLREDAISTALRERDQVLHDATDNFKKNIDRLNKERTSAIHEYENKWAEIRNMNQVSFIKSKVLI